MQVKTVLLALGANTPGKWGEPAASLMRARDELARAGVPTLQASNVYSTEPVATGRQRRYLNAVLLVRARMAPAQLLRLVKRIERRAGREHTRFHAARALDIDILDHAGRRLGWPPLGRERGRLAIPHPEMHKRAFVLVPLLDVAPAWRHSALGRSAKELLARLPARERTGVGQPLDFSATACNMRKS
jgi:2-amino-4-hydroxy-6-hydroxymethyldihydropteridine diphosphokinase